MRVEPFVDLPCWTQSSPELLAWEGEAPEHGMGRGMWRGRGEGGGDGEGEGVRDGVRVRVSVVFGLVWFDVRM